MEMKTRIRLAWPDALLLMVDSDIRKNRGDRSAACRRLGLRRQRLPAHEHLLGMSMTSALPATAQVMSRDHLSSALHLEVVEGRQ